MEETEHNLTKLRIEHVPKCMAEVDLINPVRSDEFFMEWITGKGAEIRRFLCELGFTTLDDVMLLTYVLLCDSDSSAPVNFSLIRRFCDMPMQHGEYTEGLISVPTPDGKAFLQLQICITKELSFTLEQSYTAPYHAYVYGTQFKRLKDEYLELFRIYSM